MLGTASCRSPLLHSFRNGETHVKSRNGARVLASQHKPNHCCYSDAEESACARRHEEIVGGRRQLVATVVLLGALAADSANGKVTGKGKYDDKRLLEQNRKIQQANNAPDDFPNFVREGFEVRVVTSDKYLTTSTGLIYLDILDGQGDCPEDGQQVKFHYIGYNESGRRIDSTYLQGSPAKVRLGTKALVPGFEEGIRTMRPGGKRRIIIPPELGPPELLEKSHGRRRHVDGGRADNTRSDFQVGPSTFFSSKQFEVFDIELLGVKDCQRRTIGFYSDVVCD